MKPVVCARRPAGGTRVAVRKSTRKRAPGGQLAECESPCVNQRGGDSGRALDFCVLGMRLAAIARARRSVSPVSPVRHPSARAAGCGAGQSHDTVFSTAGGTTGNDLMAPLASLAAPRDGTQRVPITLIVRRVHTLCGSPEVAGISFFAKIETCQRRMARRDGAGGDTNRRVYHPCSDVAARVDGCLAVGCVQVLRAAWAPLPHLRSRA